MYVGADVFFVVSGCLITGLIWRELTKTRALAFGIFYGRRARRLLPAALLVLVATVAISTVVLSPLQAKGVIIDAKAAVAYAVNYRFIALRTDYLAPQSLPRCSTTCPSRSKSNSTRCGRSWSSSCRWFGCRHGARRADSPLRP